MKPIYAIIFTIFVIICSLALPSSTFSSKLSKIDDECGECHSEFEAFDVIVDAPSEVPEGFEFEYKVIVRNNDEHDVQGLEAIFDLSEAEFLETSLVGGEPYHDEKTGSVGIGSVVTYTFPVARGATSALIVLDGEDGLLGLNDLDMTVTGPEGGDWRSADSGADEAVSLDRRDFKSGGYGDYEVVIEWYIGNPSISFTLTIDVEYGVDLVMMEGEDIGPGGEYTFVLPLTSLSKGENTINVVVSATAHHEHTEEDDSVTTDNYDYSVEESSTVKVGSKFVYNPPSAESGGSFDVLLYERVLGLLSAFILVVSIGFSGLIIPVSTRVEKILGGATRRVKWHCRVSQVLLLLSLIHGMLLAVSPHAANLRGVAPGASAFVIMGFLGFIGWQQKTLRPKWGNENWKRIHLIFTILAVVIVITHAILDGTDFAWLR